jgi:hypothetical protein
VRTDPVGQEGAEMRSMGRLELVLGSNIDADGFAAEAGRSKQTVTLLRNFAQFAMGCLQLLLHVSIISCALLGCDGDERPSDEIRAAVANCCRKIFLLA